MIICHWAICITICHSKHFAGRSDDVFWWIPALFEDQEKMCQIRQNYLVALIPYWLLANDIFNKCTFFANTYSLYTSLSAIDLNIWDIFFLLLSRLQEWRLQAFGDTSYRFTFLQNSVILNLQYGKFVVKTFILDNEYHVCQLVSLHKVQ